MENIDYAFLNSLGWDSHFSSQFDVEEPGVPGRVISASKGLVQVQVAPDVTWHAEVTGRFLHDATSKRDFPSVGDWVICEPIGEGRAVAHRVLARKTLLMRRAAGGRPEEQVLAANVDTAFIVTSLNSDFNARRIERYLTLVAQSGASSVVVLTKADLCDDVPDRIDEISKVAPGALVHAISSFTGEGLKDLNPYLAPGTTSVLLGSSGVGKSTLLNKLFGSDVAKTSDVREGDDKGRHTTTGRHLWRAPSGALIIDTPGMRELQLLDEGEGLEAAFQDVADLALQCKFTNCKHEKEPGCRIQAALVSGELSKERLKSYAKLLGEMAAQRRKVDKAFASQERQKSKKLHQTMKDHVARKRRGDDS